MSLLLSCLERFFDGEIVLFGVYRLGALPFIEAFSFRNAACVFEWTAAALVDWCELRLLHIALVETLPMGVDCFCFLSYRLTVVIFPSCRHAS